MHTAVTGDLPWGVFSTMLHSIIQSKKGPYGQKHKTTLGAEQVCLLPSAVHCRDSLPPGHYIIFHWDQTAVCFVRVDFRTNFIHAGTIPTAPTVQQNTVQRLTLLGSSLWANWMESASFIDLWLVYLWCQGHSEIPDASNVNWSNTNYYWQCKTLLSFNQMTLVWMNFIVINTHAYTYTQTYIWVNIPVISECI